MERRAFVGSVGKCCLGAGLCSFLSVPGAAEEREKKLPGHSWRERIDFSEGWIRLQC